MDSYLRPLVSCRLITTIIRQRNKDVREIKKIKKYSQKNIYVGIVYNCVGVCRCVCMCMCQSRLYLRPRSSHTKDLKNGT